MKFVSLPPQPPPAGFGLAQPLMNLAYFEFDDINNNSPAGGPEVAR
jgi:hypothetical protein